MTIEEANKLVFDCAFQVTLNANDFFNYACADAVTIDMWDLEEWVLPIVQEHGLSGIHACMAFIRKEMPIKPWQTEKFKAAYREIELLDPEVSTEEN